MNQIDRTENPPYINVVGKSKKELEPNEIFLNITINEKDFNSKKKLHEIEKKLFDKLSKIGLNISKDLKIKDMESNLQKNWLKGESIKSMKEYRLKVNSPHIVNQVFQELKDVGISNIQIKSLNHSEIEKYKVEAKINAIKAAKEEADLLTNAIHQNIGKAIYIQESYESTNNQLNLNSSMAFFSAPQKNSYTKESPILQFDKIHIEYSISVQFELN